METRTEEIKSQYARRFAEVAKMDEESLNLGEAAALIGLIEDPSCTVEDVELALDELADAVRPRMRARAPAIERLQVLIRFLFEEQGFSGNDRAYYEPENSYLHRVLERRLGIPISLTVLLAEVGRRLDLRIAGVGFPTHFLAIAMDLSGLYIDPFHGGHLLAYAECRALFEKIADGRIAFEPRFLQPATKRYTLIRMLNNLKGVHLARGAPEDAIGTIDRILSFAPGAVEQIRDRGLLRLKIGDYRSAVDDLGTYLERAPSASDHQAIREQILAAERRLQSLH
ncbi:MAG: transglutaminase-like domain-containing protein [Nannocystaceae bacterium]